MIGKITVLILIIPLLIWAFFATAGRWDWIAGWLYIGMMTAGSLLQGFYIWTKNPELIIRRGKVGRGTKAWDIVCLSVFGVSYIASVVVGALDGGRFHWSDMPIGLLPVGIIMLILCYCILAWSMVVNPYFEKTARIQQDYGHCVVDSGPYRIVRHPGYLAAILGFVFAPPLILGSWWAFVPAGSTLVSLVVRTVLEDRMLCRELDGYEEYIQRTRYRLIPRIW